MERQRYNPGRATCSATVVDGEGEVDGYAGLGKHPPVRDRRPRRHLPRNVQHGNSQSMSISPLYVAVGGTPPGTGTASVVLLCYLLDCC